MCFYCIIGVLASFICYCQFIYFTPFYYDVDDVVEWRNVGRNGILWTEIYPRKWPKCEFEVGRNDLKRGGRVISEHLP